MRNGNKIKWVFFQKKKALHKQCFDGNAAVKQPTSAAAAIELQMGQY